jgi:hypothetical protein
MNEEQMKRWGLYVSRPLGPEESINLFSGQRQARGRVDVWMCSSGETGIAA